MLGEPIRGDARLADPNYMGAESGDVPAVTPAEGTRTR
jgi:hypothetical protein